jgi:hypothetical protein
MVHAPEKPLDVLSVSTPQAVKLAMIPTQATNRLVEPKLLRLTMR